MSAKPQLKEVAENSKRNFDFKNEEAGATIKHNQISGNLGSLLWQHFKNEGRCESFTSDMAVKVINKDGKTKRRYPDVVVVCGEIEGKPKKKSDVSNILILFNPSLIIEVASDGTKNVDEGAKVDEYKRIESSKEYLIICQDTRKIIQYKKEGEIWLEK